MHSRIELRAVCGSLLGRHFDLIDDSTCVIGRGRDCDVVLSGDGADCISRHHCVIDVYHGGATITDLGSRNGTYLNGQCIGRRNAEMPQKSNEAESDRIQYELNNGDEIQIGTTLFRVMVQEPSEMHGVLVSQSN